MFKQVQDMMIINRIMKKTVSVPHVHMCTALESKFRLWDMILRPCYQLYFLSSSSLSFASVSPLTTFFLPVMLITLLLSLPFLFCTMKFSFHTVCHLGIAYELCISLSPPHFLHTSQRLLLFQNSIH